MTAGWNFGSLDAGQRTEALALWAKGDLKALGRLYKAAGVSPKQNCETCTESNQVKAWTEWAISEGKI